MIPTSKGGARPPVPRHRFLLLALASGAVACAGDDATPDPVGSKLMLQPVDTYEWPLGTVSDWSATNALSGERGWINGTAGAQSGTSVTLTTQAGTNQVMGIFNSLAGPNHESRSLYFEQALGFPVATAYQARVTGWKALVRGTGRLRIEFRPDSTGAAIHSDSVTVSAPDTFVEVGGDLPALGSVKELSLLVDDTSGPAHVEVDELDLEVEVPDLPELRLGFLLSYAQLLRSWDEGTGLANDHVNAPRRVQESVPATGFVALATAMAVDLGYVDRRDGLLVAQESLGALLASPRQDAGLKTGIWSHFLYNEASSSEWSTADTALGWHSAYLAARYFGLATEASDLEVFIDAIDFVRLTSGGALQWGVDHGGNSLLGDMGDFGAEWSLPRLMELFQNPAMADPRSTHTPPVYCDRDFIDHMGHLWFAGFGAASATNDRYGVNWHEARVDHLARSVAYVGGDFVGGLSPVEVRSPDGRTTYANLSLGTAGCSRSDTLAGFDGPWRSMHSVALTADLDTAAAKRRVRALLANGLLLPLTGPVESAIVSGGAIVRRHFAQVSLNSWFNVGGYYAAVMADEGRPNAIHLAATVDARMAAALKVLFP